ncbi:phenylacetic acid degradation-related domain-containing protein [Tanacetum coccineum]
MRMVTNDLSTSASSENSRKGSPILLLRTVGVLVPLSIPASWTGWEAKLYDNVYNTLFGGAVGSIAEFVAIACARTVVDEDKELFLGELNVSYLAPAVHQAEVMVDASVVRSGRNLTIVAIEFKLKDRERLTYLCRATFYNMPVASLYIFNLISLDITKSLGNFITKGLKPLSMFSRPLLMYDSN